MAYQELQAHKQDILKEIGSEWVRKEKAILVSYGVVNWGMSRKEASDMAEAYCGRDADRCSET